MNFLRNLWLSAFSLAVLAGVAQASWFKTDVITSSSGGAVDFPAGFTNAELPVVAGVSSAGVFTASTNVVAVSTAAVNYVQFGNNVHVFGETAVTTTVGTGIPSVFQIALPVPRASSFTASKSASGWCGINATNPSASGAGVVVASQSGVVANCNFNSTATGTTKVGFSFDYVLTP